MTMMVELPPEVEERLVAEAARRGVEPLAIIAELVGRGLTVPAADPHLADGPNPDQATLDLMRQWAEEDHTGDPAEIAKAEREWEEFKAAMNAHSTRGHPIYP